MFEAKVERTEPMTVAALSMRGPWSQIPEGLGRLYGWVGEKGLTPVGMPHAVYFTGPETPAADASWELWAPIAGSAALSQPDERGFHVKHIDAMTTAVAVHIGPYEKIAPVYDALSQWVAENGYEVAGPPMEAYMSDPDDVPPEEYVTQVRMPIRTG